KEEALLAMIDDWTRERTREIDGAASEASPRARLDAVLDALLGRREGGRQESQLQLELWALAQRNRNVARRLARAQRDRRDLLISAADLAQKAGALPASVDVEALAGAILALHDGLVVQGSLGRNGAARKQLEAVLELFIDRDALEATG
ncbi:MAG: TetR family transcriptional regulator C-terminal domain-containing protein, partial [Dehalococcoidia bacterium]